MDVDLILVALSAFLTAIQISLLNVALLYKNKNVDNV